MCYYNVFLNKQTLDFPLTSLYKNYCSIINTRTFFNYSCTQQKLKTNLTESVFAHHDLRFYISPLDGKY